MNATRTQSFVFGLSLPFKSLRMILFHPSLIVWSLIPIAVTLLLYSLVLSTVQERAHQVLLNWIGALGSSPEGWFAQALSWILSLSLFIFGAITFSFGATLVACPFNDFLAEAAEEFSQPKLPGVKPIGLWGRIQLIGIDFLRSLSACLINLMMILGSWGFSWIPVVNLVPWVLTFLLLTFQFTSYPQTRRSQGARVGLLFLWRHCYSCLGFGMITSFLFAIPFVSCFSLPLAVIGGTLLVARAPGDRHLRPLK